MSKKARDIEQESDDRQDDLHEVSGDILVEKTQSKAESARTTSTMFFLPPEQMTVKNHKLKDLERRIERLERKINSNERFARTMAKSVSTQALAAETILYVLRKSLHEDAEIRDELTTAIKEYDKRKIRRWFSGFFGVVLWITSVALAAGVGAFIYWAFSGK